METIRDKLLAGKANTSTKSDVESAAEAKNDLELPVILDFSNVCEMDFTAARVRIFNRDVNCLVSNSNTSKFTEVSERD